MSGRVRVEVLGHVWETADRRKVTRILGDETTRKGERERRHRRNDMGETARE